MTPIPHAACLITLPYALAMLCSVLEYIIEDLYFSHLSYKVCPLPSSWHFDFQNVELDNEIAVSSPSVSNLCNLKEVYPGKRSPLRRQHSTYLMPQLGKPDTEYPMQNVLPGCLLIVLGEGIRKSAMVRLTFQMGDTQHNWQKGDRKSFV